MFKKQNAIIFGILCLFLGLTIACFISPKISWGLTPTLQISPQSQAINPGQTIDIAVNITDAQDLYSCQISLNYDANILQYQSVTEGSFLNANNTITTFHIDPQTGTDAILGYAISRVGIIAGANGNSTLATFHFLAKNTGTSNITISINPVGIQGTKLKNSQIAAISFNKQDGTVIVNAPITIPQINLVKTADKADTSVGETLTYTITYENTGNQTATQIVITDPLPVSTSYVAGSATNSGSLVGSAIVWNIASVASGQKGSLSFQVKITN